MSTNLVIVAIPEEQDRVWKISSEKVPHLTLLFLGEEAGADTQQIMQFVEHATQMTEHGPFYLDVDRRGDLGDDQADVLFFNKRSWNLKWIKQFRGQLLQNGAVRAAYDSTQQYDEWTPHLTLGYPQAPAKKLGDDRDDYPLYSVGFDRIAVWTGNFEGPEFRLEWPEREFEGDQAIAWNDAQKAALMHLGINKEESEEEPPKATLGEKFIEHYGVKGMRWGQTRRQAHGAAKKVGSGAKKGAKALGRGVKAVDRISRDVQFENMATDGRARNQVANAAAKDFRKTDLPKINGKKEYQDAKKLPTRLRNPRDPIVKQYRKEHREAYISRLEQTANAHTNASGDRQYTIRERGVELPAQGGALPKSKYFWDVSSRPRGAAAHAADAFEGTTSIEVILDEDGFITDLKPETGDAEHSVTDVGEAFILEHYGIKGMRWGFRRNTPTAVSPTATSRVPHGNRRKTKVETEGGQNHPAHEDAIRVAEAKVKLKKSGTAALSNKELLDVANRVQLEERVKLLTSSKGKRFVKGELETEGKNLAKKGAKKGAKKAAVKVGTAALLA